MGEARWPALSITLGAETETSLEALADQVAVNQVSIAGLQADSSSHVLRAGDSMGGTLGVIAGSATAPGLFIVGDTDTGISQPAANQLGFIVGGNRRVRITDQGLDVGIANTGEAFIKGDGVGSATTPAYSFVGNTGIGLYRVAGDQLGLAVAGVQELLLTSTQINIPNAYNSTTASAANVFVDSAGRLFRDNSSAARYKTNIAPFVGASVLDLTPKEYDYQPEELDTTKKGTKRKQPQKVGDSQHTVGFILEDVAKVYPIAVTYDSEGEPDGLNWKAITTGLLAELQRLVQRVTVLEAARVVE